MNCLSEEWSRRLLSLIAKTRISRSKREPNKRFKNCRQGIRRCNRIMKLILIFSRTVRIIWIKESSLIHKVSKSKLSWMIQPHMIKSNNCWHLIKEINLSSLSYHVRIFKCSHRFGAVMYRLRNCNGVVSQWLLFKKSY